MSGRSGQLLAADIEAATEALRPALCPELVLRQITPRCALWWGREEDAAALGFPEPYWAFCWAGGQAVARHVLDGPSLAGQRVLDFGAGGGICAIAAALRGAGVLAADVDPVATTATEINARLNGVTVQTTTDDLVGHLDGAWDLVLVGDVTYEPDLAARVVAWLTALAERGTSVLVGDPNRGFIARDHLELAATYEAPADNDTGEAFRIRTNVYRLGSDSGRWPGRMGAADESHPL
jgi:predicted nicotinamide N-methyase